MLINKIYYAIIILFLGTTNLTSEELQKIKIEKPGEIAKQEVFSEQGVKRITFANNVVLNLKRNEIEKEKIVFQLNFGQGALSVPPGKEVLTHIGPSMFKIGGLTKTNEEELKRSILGKNISVHFSILENSFLIQAKTTPQDFDLNLLLCRAKIIDSAFPEESFAKIKLSLNTTYKILNSEMSKYFKNAVMRKITNNDNSLSLPNKEIFETISLIDLKEWLIFQFNNAPLEINVVGDIDEAKTIEMVNLYFGSLPLRQKFKPLEINKQQLKEKFDVKEAFITPLKNDMMFVHIPTVDFREVEDLRKLNLLGKILKNKIIEKLNKELSTSTTLNIEHFYNEDIKNLCYFKIEITAIPQDIPSLRTIIDSTIIELSEKGISLEELDKIKKPYLEILKNFSKSNEYWLNNVLRNSTAEQKYLDSVLTFLKSYEEITNLQINDIAKKYLNINKKSTFILLSKENKK